MWRIEDEGRDRLDARTDCGEDDVQAVQAMMLDRLMGNKLLADQCFRLQSSLEKGVMQAYSSSGQRRLRSWEVMGYGLEQ